MLSSDDLTSQLGRAHENGINRYLIKPIKRAELFEAVAGALPEQCAKSAPAAVQSKPREPEQTRAAASAEAPPDFAGKRILLVDDSPDNCLLIRAFLKRTGCTIDEAHDGAAAVEQFKSSGYDVVLMDVQMPVMDGLSATREIRKWELSQGATHTPVVALTASALSDDISKCIEAGADLHVSKPVRKRVLLETIERMTRPMPDVAAAG
jgi:CheY-like chemotaxis protein